MNFDPNPLFFQMCEIIQDGKSSDDKVIICNEGGTRCFYPNQKIRTLEGSKSISDINRGDIVKTFNESTKRLSTRRFLTH